MDEFVQIFNCYGFEELEIEINRYLEDRPFLAITSLSFVVRGEGNYRALVAFRSKLSNAYKEILNKYTE